MELDDPGFHHSVLADFRERLAQDDRADRLLDLALARLKEAGLVRERTTQRTDSTHVLAAVRDLTRLELVTEAVRAVLEAVAGSASHLLTGLVDEDWGRRYGRQVRLGKNPTRPKTRILAAGDDACRLLERPHRHGPGYRLGPQAETLPQIVVQNYYRDAAGRPALAHRRRRRPAALLIGNRLPLRHHGALRPSRAHHQLEGVCRAYHRDVCLRQRQRNHGRGHHLGRNERRSGPARHPHPPGPSRAAAG
ncbi:hypothetical protein [Streptomyces sp. NBC_01320]|uniref:hypothetical protein n=1 Tax=Streptomyces sp. NBC_01320 TaxID=2903824 RepID=UPI002E166C76|nr:hypothetical protein OG395_56335 [Streptomyces sp. NBC_01320]